MARIFLIVFVVFIVLTVYLIVQSYNDKHGKQNDENYENAILNFLTLFFRHRQSDGKNEIPYIHNFFIEEFGSHFGLELTNQLKFRLINNITIRHTRPKLEHKLRLRILEFLMLTANIAGIEKSDIPFFQLLRRELQISDKVFDKVLSKYYKTVEDRFSNSTNFVSGYSQKLKQAYQTLGVSPDADNDSVKKSYRACAKKHHPDSFPQSNLDLKLKAEAQFRKINEAWEFIKIARAMK